MQYDAEWVPGMGNGLAEKIARLLTQRAERGWRPQSITLGRAGDVYGALVVLEKE